MATDLEKKMWFQLVSIVIRMRTIFSVGEKRNVTS